VLYAYCVRRAGEPGPTAGLRGLDDAPVRLVEESGLGFWVSRSSSLPTTPTRLAQHDRVVQQALRSATPLPIRYGAACFQTEEAAREALVARAEPFAASLDRVAGRVEMGIRVEWAAPPSSSAAAPDGPAERRPEPVPASTSGQRIEGASAPPAGGRAFLEARKRELEGRESLRRAAAAALDEVERRLALLDVPAVRSLLPSAGTAGILAHLVRSADAEPYRSTVAAITPDLIELRLVVSGPWAPYSFA
jgi:hypothetical protein